MILFNGECRIRDHFDRFRHSFKLILDKVAIDGNTKMIKSCAVIIFLLMLGTTLAGESMKLNENDSGKTVELRVGNELEVILPGNPTTGYVWEVSSLDSNVLIAGKADFFANDKAIGSGGMEILRFHAIAAGTSHLKLIFHRPFEQTTPPLKTFEVIVIIKK
ncbi:MAG: protease inhibitor I42 family protein [Methylococcales bacterium]|nr:protease inhibitor I42 family protein [Methylococcales bacterium]